MASIVIDKTPGILYLQAHSQFSKHQSNQELSLGKLLRSDMNLINKGQTFPEQLHM